MHSAGMRQGRCGVERRAGRGEVWERESRRKGWPGLSGRC